MLFRSCPDGINYIIPGNDDSLKAIKLYATLVAEASIEGKRRRKVELTKEDSSFNSAEGGRGQVRVKRLKSRDDENASN